MTHDELYNNLKTGVYETPYPTNLPQIPPDGTVIDENMTVKWNREQIEDRKMLRKQMLNEYRNKCGEKQALFKTHACQYIIEETGINKKQAGIVFDKAYADGHANGYYDVLAHVDSLISFVDELLKAGVS